MPRAYSVDLRERSLRALASGMPAVEVARVFDVSASSLFRWRRLQRADGDVTPRVSPGRPRAISGEGDHLYLAAQGLQWQAIGKLDADRQKVALEHLELSGNTTPMADQMRSMLESVRLVEESEQSRILEWRRRMVDRYWEIVESRWLIRIVLAVFALKVIQIIGTFALGRASGSFLVGDEQSVVEWGAIIAAVSSGGLAILGLVRLQRGRRVAALHAFANLIVELFVFGLLRFALSAESRAHDEQGSPKERLDPESGIGALFYAHGDTIRRGGFRRISARFAACGGQCVVMTTCVATETPRNRDHCASFAHTGRLS